MKHSQSKLTGSVLRLQVFAPSPSLHFSVHLSFLVINCFYNRVLQCLKLLYTGKEYPKSMHSKLVSMPLHLNLKKTQGLFKELHRNLRTFQGLPLKLKDFSRLCEPCTVDPPTDRKLATPKCLLVKCAFTIQVRQNAR